MLHEVGCEGGKESNDAPVCVLCVCVCVHVDFDVHHGNGTMEVFWEDPTVLYVSVHQVRGTRLHACMDACYSAVASILPSCFSSLAFAYTDICIIQIAHVSVFASLM